MGKVHIPDREDIYIPTQYIHCSKYYYVPVIRNFYLKRLEMIMELLREENGENALDIGYGNGILFYELNKKFRHLHGIELHGDGNLVMQKLKRGEIKTYLLNGDLNKIPYKNELFDCVIAVSVLEHIPDLKQPIDEIKRTLKNGGSFICGFPVKNLLMHYIFKLIIRFDDEKDHPSSHKYIYETLKENFNVEKTIVFPSFLRMDDSLYVACRCRKKTD